MHITGSVRVKVVYRKFFCFVNVYRFCKALKVLASFLFVLVYVNIRESKTRCSVKVEALLEFVIASKRSEKNMSAVLIS